MGVRNYDHENKNTIFVHRAGASRWRSFNHGASDESGHRARTGQAIRALLAGEQHELRVADRHQSHLDQLGDRAHGLPGQCGRGNQFSSVRFLPAATGDGAGGHGVDTGGWFTTGDTLDGESDAIPTNIFVSAFVMDVNLVTFSLWQTVYQAATTFDGYSFDDAGAGKGTNYPVVDVDWYDCVKWCNARSQLSGLTRAITRMRN